MTKTYIVYELWDLERNEPFYVGKTFEGSGRLSQHITESKKKKYSKHHRMLSIGENNVDFRVVFSSENEAEVFQKEIELIESYGRRDRNTGCLLNLCDGGDGPRGFSDEQIARWCEIRKGVIPWNAGKVGYKHKVPSPKKGKPWSNKQREWYDGRSQEEIERRSRRSSESHKGQQQSDEWRAEHSSRMRGEGNPNYGKIGYFAGKTGPWAGKSHPNKGRKQGPDGKLYSRIEWEAQFEDRPFGDKS